MESSTYPDRKVIAASRMFVNLVGHKDTAHGSVDVLAGKEKRKVCKAYFGMPCETHVKCYSASGQFEFEGGTIGMPMTIWCDPSGKEMQTPGRKHYMAGSELIKQMDEALKQVQGEKIPYEPWAAAKKSLADGEAALAAEDYKKAIEAFTKVAKLKQKKLKEMGDEALKKVDAKGAELLEEAKGKLESEKEEARKLLKKVADQFRPFDCAKKAAELLKTVK